MLKLLLSLAMSIALLGSAVAKPQVVVDPYPYYSVPAYVASYSTPLAYSYPYSAYAYSYPLAYY